MIESGLVKVEGLDGLDARLAKLGPAVGFKALRSGLMAASRPMFQLARANAASTGVRNYDAGATAAAMARWTKRTSRTTTTLFLGPKNKNKKALTLYNTKHGTEVKRLNHFHLVEFGSAHGPAQPFLRPAFHATVQQVVQRFGSELRKAIEKVARAR